jgi:hypothetical protein
MTLRITRAAAVLAGVLAGWLLVLFGPATKDQLTDMRASEACAAIRPGMSSEIALKLLRNQTVLWGEGISPTGMYVLRHDVCHLDIDSDGQVRTVRTTEAQQ